MENNIIITTRNKPRYDLLKGSHVCRDGEGEQRGNNSNTGTRNKLKNTCQKKVRQVGMERKNVDNNNGKTTRNKLKYMFRGS